MTRSEKTVMPWYYYMIILCMASATIATAAMEEDFPLSVKKTAFVGSFATIVLFALPSFCVWLSSFWLSKDTTQPRQEPQPQPRQEPQPQPQQEPQQQTQQENALRDEDLFDDVDLSTAVPTFVTTNNISTPIDDRDATLSPDGTPKKPGGTRDRVGGTEDPANHTSARRLNFGGGSS